MPTHQHPGALPKGYRIGEYEIVRVLGAGGFGITYLAFDHQLDGPVALKEYFPAEAARREPGWGVAPSTTGSRTLFTWGLDRFIAQSIHLSLRPPISQFSQAARFQKEEVSLSACRPQTRGSFSSGALSENLACSAGVFTISAKSGPSPRSSLCG